jgi:hypothetical protein
LATSRVDWWGLMNLPEYAIGLWSRVSLVAQKHTHERWRKYICIYLH